MTNLFEPTLLTNRAILCLSGPDRKTLLQGLITNNVNIITAGSALYAALLTPQGKYLHDFFITEADDVLYLDCERDRSADLMRRLMMYKLRADVMITDRNNDFAIIVHETRPSSKDIFYPDPRHPAMGYREIIPSEEASAINSDMTAYDILRLSLGLPDGSRDFDIDKTLILEANMEELNAVDFNKGCYVGQEVTARMKHRSTLKKRMLPVIVRGPLPDRGTEIFNISGKKIGDIRSGTGSRAIAYFRLADLNFDESYTCGEAMITATCPEWLAHSIC